MGTKTIMSDIVKAVIFDRGEREFEGHKKYMSLVAMVIASDKPLTCSKHPEVIGMGEMNIFDDLNNLPKYEPPHKLGQIGYAILDVSNMSPDDLEPLEDE